MEYFKNHEEMEHLHHVAHAQVGLGYKLVWVLKIQNSHDSSDRAQNYKKQAKNG